MFTLAIYSLMNSKNRSKEKPFVLDCGTPDSKLPQYNSLRDKSLEHYFSSKRRRRILKQQGLMSKDKPKRGKSMPFTARSKTYLEAKKDLESSNLSRNKVTGKKLEPISAEQLKSIMQKYRNNLESSPLQEIKETTSSNREKILT